LNQTETPPAENDLTAGPQVTMLRTTPATYSTLE
jgi:hypothetical protein